MQEPFAVMAKPVGSRCNLNCDYCYYLKTETSSSLSTVMSDRQLEIFIRQYIEGNPGPDLQFTWHGGEPTLAGISFFRKAVALQQRYLPAGWNCWNNLQTNGLLLDDEWCAFLAENRFDVGLSIDGDQQTHDYYRLDRSGNGSYQRVVAACDRLKRHGIRPDLLCTVTSKSAVQPLVVYRSLKKLNTGWIQFIPIVVPEENGLSDSSVRAVDYGYFLCEIFDSWLLNDLGKLDIQLFAEAAAVLSGGVAGLCWMAPSCGKVLVLEHDGAVYACDHFVSADYCIGSINDNHLGYLAMQPQQKSFGAMKRLKLPQRCHNCSWLRLCNGGCPKDRLVYDACGEAENYLCKGLAAFFAHAVPKLQQLIEMKQRKITPQRMMEYFRKELRESWRGVAPKDPCPCGSGLSAKECCWHKRPSVAIER